MMKLILQTIRISFFSLAIINLTAQEANPADWRTIEMLAEEHPYIVALLDREKVYSCTGTIINQRTVLTSGSCVKRDPNFVAVGAAAIENILKTNMLLKIAFKRLHKDYALEVNIDSDQIITQMYNNIGLIYTVKPHLELFVYSAVIGNYSASELMKSRLLAVGYGKIKEHLVALQKQIYHQIPCKNPKWHYCVCGSEYTTGSKTYLQNFGEGGPILLDSLVVGIATFPCGSLAHRNLNDVYNIFTVIGPYLHWFDEPYSEPSLKFVSQEINTSFQRRVGVECFFLCLIVSKAIC
ncbi:unnamed protein product [Parnassius apollo]|uniref:(apollo) hypothetical protein n=1 Tax=Parnassius apollo TaxID=110799 RepID=A0A8S3XJG0_PARAO|nr:unnamed protein product [Parnassius apollo]